MTTTQWYERKYYKEIEDLPEEKYDVMVIGGGIAGMQASLDLGDMGFKVVLVEREPTIGGYMFKLSKTFPTLDCASCISTPKMASVAHHPNITLMTYCEVEEIEKKGEGFFKIKVLEKPRFVDATRCTGCRQCENACPVIVPNEYDRGLVGRKAVYIPFDTAVPRVALVDLDHCVFCGQCERACPTDPPSIDFTQSPKIHHINVNSVIISTGFRLFDAKIKKEYHYGEYPNVIDAMQMDRLLAPTRPYHAILRPSDGKEPSNIGYVLCTGSRDITLGNPNCSQICCMYSIKQAQLLMGALPLADITIYCIDIRAFGKGFEEFYQQAREMGVNFVKGRIAKIEQKENKDLIVWFEDIGNGGRLKKAEHDLVVLSVGLLPNPGIEKIFKNEKLELDDIGWIISSDENSNPAKTSIDGVFAAGCAIGPKDIPDSVLEGGAAASQCAAYLNEIKKGVKRNG